MASAMSGLFRLMQFFQVVLIFSAYGVLGVAAVMLYRVSRELAEVRRTLTDMEERIVLALLPREEKPDKAERP